MASTMFKCLTCRNNTCIAIREAFVNQICPFCLAEQHKMTFFRCGHFVCYDCTDGFVAHARVSSALAWLDGGRDAVLPPAPAPAPAPAPTLAPAPPPPPPPPPRCWRAWRECVPHAPTEDYRLPPFAICGWCNGRGLRWVKRHKKWHIGC